MKTVSNQSDSPPQFWDSARWPLLVVGLLLGHVCMMMVGVTWAMANKSAFTSIEQTEIDTNQSSEPQVISEENK